MGEIKSAIELAMERTKGLVMDEKEKEEFARKDLEEKLKAVVRRFLEGIAGSDEFLREFKHIAGDERRERDLLVDLVIAEFDSSIENERLFSLLEIVGEELGGGLGEEARGLKKRFRDELKARETGIREDIVERLRLMGISGSAVEPNLPEWEEWKDAAREVGNILKKGLHEWRNRIQAVSP